MSSAVCKTDIALHGEIQKDTLTALNQAGYNYHDGQLEMLEKERLDSIIHDNDIDLDREKNREQLGFRNQDIIKITAAPAVPIKMSMKERMAAAKQKAEQRANSKDKQQQELSAERSDI